MAVRWGSFQPHPGTQPDCPLCGGRGFGVRREGERAVAELCACVGPCTRCRGTGWVPSGPQRGAPVARCRACQEPARRLGLYNKAGIPAKHARSALDTFDASRAPELTRAFLEVNRWIRDYKPGEPNQGLVLYGPVGTGKTHLIIGLLRALALEHGVSVRFVEFSLLLQDLRSGFDKGVAASELVQPLVEVDVLAIDELGKGRNTEWEQVVLDELISRRYNAMGTLMGTTNYAPRSTGTSVSNLAAPRESGLADRVGDRVFSRLSEMVSFVPVISTDWRRQAPMRGA